MLIVAWEVTAACNLSCGYCRASASSLPDAEELSTEEALSFLDSIATLHPMLILSGGEPLLRPDIFQIARHAVALGMRVSLASNGTLLTPQVADEIAASAYRESASAWTAQRRRSMIRSAAWVAFRRPCGAWRACAARSIFRSTIPSPAETSLMSQQSSIWPREWGLVPCTSFSWWPPAGAGRRISSRRSGKSSFSWRSTGSESFAPWRCRSPARPSTLA